MSGTLYICATPIGNMEDITLRAIRVLKECDIVAAEDTRHTMALLNHLGIKARLESYREHNKRAKGAELIQKLKEGANIALVSDAGTPAISDPGADLVKLCIEEGVNVTSLPGACAAVTALTLSGLDTRRFVFEGFLPADKKERRQVIKRLKTETRTVVLYEAPHRLKTTLKELYAELGERRLACCRELSKKFEEVRLKTLSEHIAYFNETDPRGEFALVLEGKSEEELKAEESARWDNLSVEEHLKLYEDKGVSRKDALKLVADDRGVPKREIYAAAHKK